MHAGARGDYPSPFWGSRKRDWHGDWRGLKYSTNGLFSHLWGAEAPPGTYTQICFCAYRWAVGEIGPPKGGLDIYCRTPSCTDHFSLFKSSNFENTPEATIYNHMVSKKSPLHQLDPHISPPTKRKNYRNALTNLGGRKKLLKYCRHSINVYNFELQLI